jgi:hypothetical protein
MTVFLLSASFNIAQRELNRTLEVFETHKSIEATGLQKDLSLL